MTMKKLLAIIGAFVTGGISIALAYAPTVLAKFAEDCTGCPALSSN